MEARRSDFARSRPVVDHLLHGLERVRAAYSTPNWRRGFRQCAMTIDGFGDLDFRESQFNWTPELASGFTDVRFVLE